MEVSGQHYTCHIYYHQNRLFYETYEYLLIYPPCCCLTVFLSFQMSLEPTDKYLNPLKVLSEVEKILPDNAILVVDGGDFVGTASYILR